MVVLDLSHFSSWDVWGEHCPLVVTSETAVWGVNTAVNYEVQCVQAEACDWNNAKHHVASHAACSTIAQSQRRYAVLLVPWECPPTLINDLNTSSAGTPTAQLITKTDAQLTIGWVTHTVWIHRMEGCLCFNLLFEQCAI